MEFTPSAFHKPNSKLCFFSLKLYSICNVSGRKIDTAGLVIGAFLFHFMCGDYFMEGKKLSLIYTQSFGSVIGKLNIWREMLADRVCEHVSMKQEAMKDGASRVELRKRSHCKQTHSSHASSWRGLLMQPETRTARWQDMFNSFQHPPTVLTICKRRKLNNSKGSQQRNGKDNERK